jgi:hypothetical protein
MSRFSRCRDYLIAIGGTLICLLVTVFLDIVVDGNYMFSALVCPIWLIVGVVRTVLQRPRLSVTVARILIPVVTVLLVVANYRLQRTIAMGNAADLIKACEQYREANGSYPEHLNELVPRYLSSVPRAKYCCSESEFRYYGPPHPRLVWWEFPPFGRQVYVFETGNWRYVD